MSFERIEVYDVQDKRPVDALLRTDLGWTDLLDAESTWSPARTRAVRRMRRTGISIEQLPQNRHWNWFRKANELRRLKVHVFGIECESEWQGLIMLTDIGNAARLQPDVGRGIVYVKYLESAPWNVRDYYPNPRFGAIGTRLLEAAVRHSINAGFEGRLGLHALPNSRTEGFYQRRGLIRIGEDPEVEDLPYYELTRNGARAFLKGEPT